MKTSNSGSPTPADMSEPTAPDAAAVVTESEPDQGIGVLSRRNIMVAGAVGVAGAALAACSSSSSSGGASSSAAKPTGSASGSGAGQVIATVAAVPVGGAILQKANNTTYVVAQETAGNITAHLGICTHEGCPLTTIAGANADCPCHGSQFNVFSGAVEKGPAVKPLPSVPVKVSGANVVLG